MAGLLATAAVVLASASPASALASVPTKPAPVAFWVAPTGVPNHVDNSCKTAAFSTIQIAVFEAEAYQAAHPKMIPTINVCPAKYSEQVTIVRSLVLTRAPVPAKNGPVTIELPASVGTNQTTGLSSTNCQALDVAKGVQRPQSVIEVCSAALGGANTKGVSVTIRGVTVAGNWPHSVCYDSLYGIQVGGGATLTLTGSTIQRAGAYPLNGCQGGIGVDVGLSTTGQIGHAFLTGDTFTSYQKGGIKVSGPGSTAVIGHVTVTGVGPTSGIAQNGIEFIAGATGSVTLSTVTGNNYTGNNNASSAGILLFGGCSPAYPLVKHVSVTHNKLVGNDIGVAFANYDAACAKSASVATSDTACYNQVSNSHGYPHGVPSAAANITGWAKPDVGYQAGIMDVGNHDVICHNSIFGAGYSPLGATNSLPNPPAPAFVRPVDIVSGPAISPSASNNTFNGSNYHPAVVSGAKWAARLRAHLSR